MSDSANPTLHALRRLSNRSDDTADRMADFTQRQSEGEKPDPEEFMKILEQRSVVHDAMRAQFKLYEKPIKTVLQETK